MLKYTKCLFVAVIQIAPSSLWLGCNFFFLPAETRRKISIQKVHMKSFSLEKFGRELHLEEVSSIDSIHDNCVRRWSMHISIAQFIEISPDTRQTRIHVLVDIWLS